MHEGNVGLFKAYKNFDQTRETKFSTYAYPRIEKEIKDIKQLYNSSLSSQDSIIRLGKKIVGITNEFYIEKGCIPTVEYLSAELNESLADLTNAIYYNDFKKLSLNAKSDNNIDNQEFIEQTIYDSAENIVDQKYISEVVKKELSSLTEIHRSVILYSFAIPPYEKMSQKKISERLHISQSRVSEILSLTIAKLKKNKKIEELYDEIKN
jgi:RNA polymerase sigma factor (sigma-70 family)